MGVIQIKIFERLIAFYLSLHTWLYLILSLSYYLFKALNFWRPPFLGLSLVSLILLVTTLETAISPISADPADWNPTFIKLLVVVVFFTGVFRTTCVTEEIVEIGNYQKPKTKLLFYIVKYGPNNTKIVDIMNGKERKYSSNGSEGLTDPNTVNPSGDVEAAPSPSSHFYTASLPAQPLRTHLAAPADLKVGPEGGCCPAAAGPAAGLKRKTCVMPRQDLDQITTFSEILDSLKNYPSEKEPKEMSNTTKPKDMMYMAPLGPSQVDIGNLSSR